MRAHRRRSIRSAQLACCRRVRVLKRTRAANPARRVESTRSHDCHWRLAAHTADDRSPRIMRSACHAHPIGALHGATGISFGLSHSCSLFIRGIVYPSVQESAPERPRRDGRSEGERELPLALGREEVRLSASDGGWGVAGGAAAVRCRRSTAPRPLTCRARNGAPRKAFPSSSDSRAFTACRGAGVGSAGRVLILPPLIPPQ